MIVYHGSDHIIKKPVYNGSKPHNDYGNGFYMSEDIELAKEWACRKNNHGIVNQYELNTKNLKILNLNDPQYNILNWLALLTKHRTYWQQSSISFQAKKYLQDYFYIDTNPYDIIIGYRADDSYFSFAKDFISNTISLQKLSTAMHLGKLGEQIVLKSEKAFKQIKFVDAYRVDKNIYYEKKVARDKKAKKDYQQTKNRQDSINDLYMIDIIRQEIKNNDPRL